MQRGGPISGLQIQERSAPLAQEGGRGMGARRAGRHEGRQTMTGVEAQVSAAIAEDPHALGMFVAGRKNHRRGAKLGPELQGRSLLAQQLYDVSVAPLAGYREGRSPIHPLKIQAGTSLTQQGGDVGMAVAAGIHQGGRTLSILKIWVGPFVAQDAHAGEMVVCAGEVQRCCKIVHRLIHPGAQTRDEMETPNIPRLCRIH